MSTDHRIRFAAQLQNAPNGSAWVALAQRAERIGFAAISMPDHLWTQFSPIPALAAAAVTTERVALTMAVLANDFRNPVMLAKEAATLQVLSGGRLELGLGAGWRQEEYRQAGLAFDPPGVRIDRLEESISILRRLFAGETVSHDGTHYRVDGYELKPPAEPAPTLVLGGGAPRMLGVAARLADVVSIATDNRHRTGTGAVHNANATRAAAERAVGWIHDAAPHRSSDLELNIRVLLTRVGDDRDTVAASWSEGFGLPAAELAVSPFCAVGNTRQIADHFRRIRDELGISYFTVSADAIEPLAAVVEELTGT